MELNDFKIKVNSEAESREVQELFFALGYKWHTTGSEIIKTGYVGVFYIFAYRDDFKLTHAGHAETFNQKSDFKEITLQQLRNLVKQKQQVVVEQQENTVKYEEWLNLETFEVKSIPQQVASHNIEQQVEQGLNFSDEYMLKVKATCQQDVVIKGLNWVKIPEDAEFAVSNGQTFNFRNGSLFLDEEGKWVKGGLIKTDFPVHGWKVVWERDTTTQDIVDTCCKTKDMIDTDFSEDRTNIFKKLLQGVKFQYRYNDAGQWHNLTDKSLCHLMKPNVAIREKPQKITIDGIEMDKDAAIKYIEKHY